MWPFILFSLAVYGFANFYRKKSLEGIDPFIAGFGEFASQTLFAWIAVLLFAEFSLSTLTFNSVAAGFLVFIGVSSVFLALRSGYASSVITIFNLNALVTVPLALLFLGESLSLQALAGVALAMLVIPLLGSLRVNGGEWLKYALIALVAFGAMNYFNATAARASGVLLAYAFMTTIGFLLFSALVLAKKRDALPALSFKSAKRLFFNGFLFAAATISLFTAFSLGPASIIIPVVNMNLLIGAILASVFYKERLGAKGWAAVALAVVSVWLLAG